MFFMQLQLDYFTSVCFFFSSRRRHTICLSDWSSDVCSSDLAFTPRPVVRPPRRIIRGYRSQIQSPALDDERRRGRRSEERRVGKECRSRWPTDELKKKWQEEE